MVGAIKMHALVTVNAYKRHLFDQIFFTHCVVQNISIYTQCAILFLNRCEIDSGESADSALYLNITGSNRAKLMLEMTPGFHTQNFVGEIFTLTNSGEEKNRSHQNFDWLQKYCKGTQI